MTVSSSSATDTVNVRDDLTRGVIEVFSCRYRPMVLNLCKKSSEPRTSSSIL
jgi:hypothetical protein